MESGYATLVVVEAELVTVGPSPEAIELPLVPLKNLVVFPHMIVALYVGREKSVRALEDAMLDQRKVFLCGQRQVDCDWIKVGL